MPTAVIDRPASDHGVLEERVAALEEKWDQVPDTNVLNLLVFSGERDRLLAAFTMATGAAACGLDVSMFFTFWATPVLRKSGASAGGKSFVERAFGWMLPRGPGQTKLSQMDMLGIGRQLMAREMRRKNIVGLNELIETAADLGVKILVCDTSMQLMGIHREELIDYAGLEICGVAQFVSLSSSANTTLFI